MTRALVANLGQRVEQQLASFTDLSKISVPFTTITNRAPVTDLANDLLPRMGIERVSVQHMQEVQGEFGPNGERVFKPYNDVHDQVRIVGNGWRVAIDNNGIRPIAVNANDFVEIVFYGTALNMLTMTDGLAPAPDLRVSVDGGAEGGNVWFTTTVSLLSGRNYNPNQVLPIVSGLSLGMHTVKIRQNNTPTWSWGFYGFEIVTATGTSPNVLRVNPGTSYEGGKTLSKTTGSLESYNSGFESGVLGTRGGRVLVYQKSDGTVAKAVQPTDSGSLTLGSTNHANESIIRTYYWREFGMGRSDDFSFKFSNGLTTAAMHFISDDNSVSLSGSDLRSTTYVAGMQPPIWVTTSGFITITFVGTGLDVMAQNDGNTRDWTAVTLNGVSLGAYTPTAWAGIKKIPIVSGLPYGTHTVRLSGDGGEPGLDSIVVYGPKKPTLPAGAVELAEYFIMADYVANATQGDLFVSSGILRKSPFRELMYTGTWTTASAPDPNSANGGYVDTTNNGATARYTFYGTGFDLRFYSAAGAGVNIFQISVDGSTNLSGFTTSFYGAGGHSLAFTPATGQMTGNSAADDSGLAVRGLTLGLHTVVITYNNGASNVFRLNSFDLITPIHTTKMNGPFTRQNTLSVGSQGIKDNRTLSENQYKARKSLTRSGSWVNDTHVSNAGQFQPLSQINASIYLSKESDVEVIAEGQFGQSTATVQNMVLKVSYGSTEMSGGNGRTITWFGAINAGIEAIYRDVVRLPAGWYTFVAHWHNNNAAQINASNAERHSLTVNVLD